MEAGSLLPIALEHARALRGENVRTQDGGERRCGGDDNSATADLDQKNCVVLDIFSLRHCSCNVINHNSGRDNKIQSTSSSLSSYMDHLLYLAKLADRCNRYLQQQNQSSSSSSSSPYFWHYGGDGPVFGITTTTMTATTHNQKDDRKQKGGGRNDSSEITTVPHLRATCRYGPNVQDEWYAIELLRQLTANIEDCNGTDDNEDTPDLLAARAWDLEDGQVILIQLADLLPQWVDEDPTDRHQYACWFVNGNLQVLDKPHINLLQALNQLSQETIATAYRTSTHPSLDRAIKFWLELNAKSNAKELSSSTSEQTADTKQQLQQHTYNRNQRTPMVLPREVSWFLQDRPELLQTAIQAYCELATTTTADSSTPTGSIPALVSDLSQFDDWVWTKQTISRTNYAMLRTVMSVPSSPDNCNDDHIAPLSDASWMSTPEGIPSSITVQVRKKYVRQCNMDTTPHLRNAVSFGVRVVVGLQYLAMVQQRQQLSSMPSILLSCRPLKSLQQRITYWSRIELEYYKSVVRRHKSHRNSKINTGNNNVTESSSSLIMKSYLVGPNQSSIDLTYILKCPVYPEESHNWITVLSHPQTSLLDQIRYGLKKQRSSADVDHGDNDSDMYWMPQPDQVDDDSWMDILSDTTSNDDRNKPGVVGNVHDIDRVLQRFQHFVMHESSGIDGVEATANESTEPSRELLKIRPRVFLNMLHAVFRGEKLVFPKVATSTSATTNTGDNFFYQEDYDLLEPDDSNDDDDENDGGVDERIGSNTGNSREDFLNMKDLMAAMDSELSSRTESRRYDTVADTNNGGDENDAADIDNSNDKSSDPAAGDEEIHVLSNLLQSLEASAGQSGPVSNMLKEMEDGREYK
jgi:SGT1 protein